MKKLTFILFIIFAFVVGETIAQVSTYGTGNDRSIYKTQGAWDHASTSGLYGGIGNYAVDLMSTDKNAADAANSFVGPTHNGMGAVGYGSFTSGLYNRASGCGAFVGGFHNVAGPLTIQTTTADGGSIGQTAFGYGTQATGNASFSAGEGTEASGSHGVVFGKNTVASGSFSTALGFETDATDYGSFVIGSYNSSGSSATSAASFSTSAPAFVIGNGTASNAKSDAFKVLFNGNTTVAGDITVTGNDMTFGNGETISNASDGTVTITSGTVSLSSNATIGNDLTVSGDIVVSSDARLKANIVSLGSTLARLLLIDGKTYTMKKDGKQKIGVLAQDIQNVFPELVSEDDNEMLAVNYQGLVPVLINALKEQDDKISRLEVLVEKLMSDK